MRVTVTQSVTIAYRNDNFIAMGDTLPGVLFALPAHSAGCGGTHGDRHEGTLDRCCQAVYDRHRRLI
jgi:hypothetical protein